jgi:1-acyl-sn-glycerol-3-phosphate acyltransferase
VAPPHTAALSNTAAMPPDFLSIFPALKTFSDLYAKAAQAQAGTLTGRSLKERDPKVLDRLLLFWEWLYHHYFRVSSDGWEHIPAAGPMLLVGSHNGGLAAPDMFMMMCEWYRRFGTERLAYGLMHPKVWQAFPDLAKLAVQGGALQARPQMAIAALRQEASVLVYPGGIQDVFRPYSMRHKVHFQGREGFIKLALREEVPIVPLVSCGAHETFMVLTDLYPQVKQLNKLGMPWLLGIDPEVFPLFLGLPWGLAIGPLPHIPLPTEIRFRICPPVIFERYGSEAARDPEYVTACYRQVCCQMQASLDQLVDSCRSTSVKIG